MIWTWLRRWLGLETSRSKAPDEVLEETRTVDEVRTRHACYHDIAQARLRAQDE